MAYTNIDDPSAFFQTALYTASGSNLSITNDGNSDLKPDFIWIKQRNGTENHMLVDSTRGVSKYLLSDSTSAEQTVTSRVETLDTDGFTVNGASNPVNASGGSYVAWQWKANGGTTVSNTDGDLRSVTVQANQDAGFSIVRFLGGTTPYTAGHGLGVAPDVIISKRLGATVGWYVYHKDVGAGKYLQINNANAAATSATEAFTSAPTSTIFTGGTGIGGATDYYINYCFAEKQGYSKFGSYVGNGSGTSDGTFNGRFVYTGFKPAWVLIKRSDYSAGDAWTLFDNKRPRSGSTGNYINNKLGADSTAAESGNVYDAVDFLSNGFKLRTGRAGTNASGSTYIYMAFAESPFVTSTGIPTTAR